jgi:hypothetical protein
MPTAGSLRRTQQIVLPTISTPATEMDSWHETMGASMSEQISEQCGQPVRILIIDNDPELSEAIVSFLDD